MAPKTVTAIYEDFLARREGLLNALTYDANEFYEQCDPGRENLCLYGRADGTWAVGPPAAEVPPAEPEPALGVNFARDGMDRRDWLALCAAHADAWLAATAAFHAARFDDNGRAELFALQNQHPTVFEVVTGRVSRARLAKRRAVTRRGEPRLEPAAAPEATAGAAAPLPCGAPVAPGDVGPALVGRQAELFWPDDGRWYLCYVQGVEEGTARARVLYPSGESEELDLGEVVAAGHMRLLS